MVEAKYDVVIIGAGAAGLSIAGVLAAKERKKVLVVEKEDFVGGRLLSFVGNKDSVSLLDKKLDAKGLEKAMAAVRGRVARTKPDLPTMVKKGYLNGYTFEVGVHATFWGDKGRMACLLNFLGKHIDMPGNFGFAVVDPRDNKWYELQKGGGFEWMSPEASADTKRLLREMTSMSLKDAEKYDLISFGQWLNERTKQRETYEFLKGLASIHVLAGEGDMMPAGDFIKFMAIAKDIGMNMRGNSTGLIGTPGFIKIGVELAEVVRENGGQILLGTPVEKVIISNKKATGVVIKTKDGLKEIAAQSVICTVPVKHIFNMIPENNFPADFVKMIKEQF